MMAHVTALKHFRTGLLQIAQGDGVKLGALPPGARLELGAHRQCVFVRRVGAAWHC
jgi:hypothetical protein